MKSGILTTVFLLIAWTSSPVSAQQTLDQPVGEFVGVGLDLGTHTNHALAPVVARTETVRVEDAAWLRLYFGQVELGPGSLIRVTSLLDGQVQDLDNAALEMWNYTSAYFNGDSVRIELIAGPQTADNQVVVDMASVEFVTTGAAPQALCGICGNDDRVLSNEDWSGRIVPVGCTGSIFTEDSCIVSAGHCVGNDNVIEFRVPPSTAGCNLVHPPLAEQFPIVDRMFLNAGVGSDWAVMVTGTNNLGETIFDRYGVLRLVTPQMGLGEASVTGFGVDTECVRNQVQQFNDGTISALNSTWYEFFIDSTFGNSGSALLNADDLIVGVVTHCQDGCPNIATRADRSDFTAARDTLCDVPPPPPANDDCADRELIVEGTRPISTRSASSDGLTLPPECDEGFGADIDDDIWYCYIALCDGTATVDLCTDTDFDTRIAVYDTCDCPATNDRLLACNDNGCDGAGSPSLVQFPVVFGGDYLVRIGGPETGDGMMTITCEASGGDNANIIGAASLRTHGAEPGMELAVNLVESGGIEPRQGGVAKLSFEMSEPMNIATVEGQCDNVQIACTGPMLSCTDAALEPDGRTVTVLVDGPGGATNCCTFDFAGMETNSGGIVLDAYEVVVLEGDVNFSGNVTGSDPSLIKPHFGEIAGVDLAGPQFDYNVDGAVTGGDFSLLKARLGNVAPACP